MPLQIGNKYTLPSGETIKVIDITDTLVYTKVVRRPFEQGKTIMPLWIYDRADMDIMESLEMLDEMQVASKTPVVTPTPAAS